MGRMIPFSNIPNSGFSLDEGAYVAEVQEFEAVTTRKKGKLAYNTALQVVEPPAYAGATLFDNFTIGTDVDPEALETATWNTSVGAKRLKRFLARARVVTNQDIDETELIAKVKGQRVLIQTIKEKQAEKFADGTPNPKAGRIFNKVVEYYAVGERALGPNPGRAPAVEPSEPEGGPSTLVCPTCYVGVEAAKYGAHMVEHS